VASVYKPKFSPGKFKELMLYCAHKQQQEQFFGLTILNKVFFFSDFLSFGLLGEPITGATYVRRQWGPVPRELRWMAGELEGSRDAMFTTEPVFNYRQKRLVALRPANTHVFTAEEVDLVDDVIRGVSKRTASDVSNLSHDRSLAWEVAEDGEEIPYSTVFLSRRKPTREDKARGLELARKYGWLDTAK
jgi:hypothetical protein